MKGLSVPVGVGPDGRALTDEGEDQLRKIIALRLSFGESENPFQTIGIPSPIFEINDPTSQAIIKNWIQRTFRILRAEGRARLVDRSLKFEEEEGEMILSLRYVNLKTDDPVTLRADFDRFAGRFRVR